MLHLKTVTCAGVVLTTIWTIGLNVGAAPTSAAVRPRAATPPTFAADVAPLIYSHCAVCHRPGQSAPFSLLSYDDVKKRGALIVNVTSQRYMPPWHATPAPEFPSFVGERRLSDADVALLKAWVDAGMPAGELDKAPPPPTFPGGWALGAPDVVLEFPRAIDVPADGPDLYRNIVLPLDLPDDQWIAAIDFEPSARRVVHHALFFIAPASDAANVREDDVLPGLGRGGAGRIAAASGTAGGLGGWVPGLTPRFFPDDIGQALPAHSSLVAQLHLHPSGKAEREQGRLAIYFAKKAPSKSIIGIQVPPLFGVAMGIDIPAGEARYTIKDSFILPVDIEALGARGHAHYLAKEMKMTATLPDGSTKGLLWIDDWDFGWQDSYFYTAPFGLPRGTRIDVEIAYDNSAGNPRNPNTPPRRVEWGRGSLDEMGSMTLLVAAPRDTAEATLLRDTQVQHFRQQLAFRILRRQ